MAKGIAVIALLATLSGQAETPEIPNPCAGEPSETCEAALTEAALTWEERYSLERAAHLHTIRLCTDALTEPVPAPKSEDDGKLWVYVGVSGTVGLVVGAIIGAIVLSNAP